jgi:hypothetical protein
MKVGWWVGEWVMRGLVSCPCTLTHLLVGENEPLKFSKPESNVIRFEFQKSSLAGKDDG